MPDGPVEMPDGPVDEFTRAYRAMRNDDDTQFAPVELPETPARSSPDWLSNFFEWLGELLRPVTGLLVEGWPIIKWLLIGGAAALALYIVWRIIGPDFLARKSVKPEPEEWVPDAAAAMALLEDADRLAAEGRYDEATHLLLQRSVGQIAEARPDLVEPSSTAREISAEPELPQRARAAFGIIAERVERSLFALRTLSQDDWQTARDAYADFALAPKSIAA